MYGYYEKLYLNSLFNSSQTDSKLNLPNKSVEDMNIYINSIGDKAKDLDQKDITRLYNSWPLEDQNKFIWANGVKPDFISRENGLVL